MTKTRLVTALTISAATVLTACGNNSNEPHSTAPSSAPVTETVTESATGPSSQTRDVNTQDSDPHVTLDGRDISLNYSSARCNWDEDEGFPQLEFDVGELSVEVVLSDPLRLDDFSLDEGGEEWEATKQQRHAARITVDGSRYTITSQVDNDAHNNTAELEASFTCAN